MPQVRQKPAYTVSTAQRAVSVRRRAMPQRRPRAAMMRRGTLASHSMAQNTAVRIRTSPTESVNLPHSRPSHCSAGSTAPYHRAVMAARLVRRAKYAAKNTASAIHQRHRARRLIGAGPCR